MHPIEFGADGQRLRPGSGNASGAEKYRGPEGEGCYQSE